MAECTWLEPETVGQFKFLEWTPADHLRHVRYAGLRTDKEARAVVKEGEAAAPPRRGPQSERESLPRSGKRGPDL